MDILISFVVVLVVAGMIGAAIVTWGLRGPEIIGAGFTGYRPDGWPRGVQERDDPWGWRAPPREPEPDATFADDVDPGGGAVIVEIQPVHPTLGRSHGTERSARR